ncbi:MAG: proline hydroxylase [Gammaproteobacteria bacterium]|nr:proline hydroxylase [Gammaproteobacteria bacterium]NKB63591.1 proline hydroxylase [Gammaproteobacteria bacterium]NKB64517.1 proline hydroxylase [Gammaproteobacteria bacterium]
MKLNPSQIDTLQNQGFLVLPERFSEEEVALIQSQMPMLLDDHHPGNVIEKESGVVRTAMGLHLRNEVFAQLANHPKLIEPAFQIRPEPMYIQQVKVNVKAAFSGSIWQWHYDFATHHEEDGVPEPLALNLHIFLDDVNHYNGPLYFVPGSHRHGEHGAWLDDQTTSYPLWIVENRIVEKLIQQNGIQAATGEKGTMLIFYDTLLHGSPNNMSPWDRAIFSLILNPISNAYQKTDRPDYKHHRDLTPVIMSDPDCLSLFLHSR